MTLTGAVESVAGLDQAARERMLALMTAHYEGVRPEAFATDLAQKDVAVVLRDEEGCIQGFSTLQTLEAQVEGRAVTALFSGDTIVDRAHWGSPALAAAWGQFVFEQSLSAQDGELRYWFLISKGYRTYRFLPLFFKAFHPRFDEETPAFERELIRRLALEKYPGAYDESAGLLRFGGAKDRLREELAGVDARRLERDPHVRFFLERNPGFAAGDELCCVARLALDNLTPAAQRMLRRSLALR